VNPIATTADGGGSDGGGGRTKLHAFTALDDGNFHENADGLNFNGRQFLTSNQQVWHSGSESRLLFQSPSACA